MGKQISDFDETRIRGIDLDKKARLVQLADDQGKSLNQFLLEVMNRLAERHEIMEIETKYSELVGMTANIIEKNSRVLDETYQMLQIITGGNMMSNKSDRVRVNAHISYESKDKLAKIMEQTGARSYGETIEKILHRLETDDANKLLGEFFLKR